MVDTEDVRLFFSKLVVIPNISYISPLDPGYGGGYGGYGAGGYGGGYGGYGGGYGGGLGGLGGYGSGYGIRPVNGIGYNNVVKKK